MTREPRWNDGDRDANLEAMFGQRQQAAALVGGVLAIEIVIVALLVYRLGVAPADPPAVMTGAPASASMIPRLEPVTTAGHALGTVAIDDLSTRNSTR